MKLDIENFDLSSEKLTRADLKIIFSMLVKLSETCRNYELKNYAHGYDEHSEEREYFQERLKAIRERK